MNKPGQFIQDRDGDWAYIKENGQLATGPVSYTHLVGNYASSKTSPVVLNLICHSFPLFYF